MLSGGIVLKKFLNFVLSFKDAEVVANPNCSRRYFSGSELNSLDRASASELKSGPITAVNKAAYSIE